MIWRNGFTNRVSDPCRPSTPAWSPDEGQIEVDHRERGARCFEKECHVKTDRPTLDPSIQGSGVIVQAGLQHGHALRRYSQAGDRSLVMSVHPASPFGTKVPVAGGASRVRICFTLR